MPQLHLYVPEDIAKLVRRHAEAEGMSVSQLLAQVVKREFHSGWPEGFTTRYTGFWKGPPMEEIERPSAEESDFEDSQDAGRPIQKEHSQS